MNVKAIVDTFNQEKALVEAFSVVLKTDCETDESLYSTSEKHCATRHGSGDYLK